MVITDSSFKNQNDRMSYSPVLIPGAPIVLGNRTATANVVSETEGKAPDDQVSNYVGTKLALKLPRLSIPKMDANPQMHLGTFLTTDMDDQALRLMNESCGKNFVDFGVYPETTDISERCRNMIASTFHAPGNQSETFKGTGCSTVGSSEAIFLGVLALKIRWQENRKKNNLDASKPNMTFGSNAHQTWQKAACYLEIDPRIVKVNPETLCVDPVNLIAQVDENTISITMTLGDMPTNDLQMEQFTGKYEDIQTLDNLLGKKMEQPGWDSQATVEKWSVGIHVDAATGGFVAPSVSSALTPNDASLIWDFQLPNVVSINVSGHKYGLTYPGLGWALWREPQYVPEQMTQFNNVTYGKSLPDYNINHSKGTEQIIGQYYIFTRFGKDQMQEIILSLLDKAHRFALRLVNNGNFKIWSAGDVRYGVPMISFSLMGGKAFDEEKLSACLRTRGWIVPVFKRPETETKHNLPTESGESGKMLLRIIIRDDFSDTRADKLYSEISAVVALLLSDPKADSVAVANLVDSMSKSS
ncbi:hypothetical protein DFQ30_007635 [Apophysomyces sp. BC1015]|nr:hypothetical protein DFQ30_007635 [Apophysomyces sp. BC1015]